MCGYGWLIPAIPWTTIAWVWGYNLVWLLVLGAVRVAAERLLDDRTARRQRSLAIVGAPISRRRLLRGEVMDYRKRFAVEPGSRVKLKAIDPAFHGKHADEASAEADLAREVSRLTALQYRLYAEKKHACLIVLQGIDAAGKDGTVWRADRPQPAGHHRHRLQAADRARARSRLPLAGASARPALGQVAIFNRSHYEDVLVVRVHDLVPKAVWSNDMTRSTPSRNSSPTAAPPSSSSSSTSPRGAARPLQGPPRRPSRRWKISDTDYKERAFWGDYARAYEAMLERCSTEHAPWYVIPSNHKWFRNFAVSRILADTLDDLKMKMPKPTVDIDAIRKEYHAAAGKSA